MRRFIPLFIFAIIFALPALALGQPCPPVDVNLSVADQAQEWWMVLLDFLLQLVTPIAIAVLTTLAGVAVRKWGKKLDTDKQEALVRLTDSLITSGISFAEEQGRKALRTDKVKTESAQKLSMATDFIAQQLSTSGLPGIAEDELVKLIESRLAQERTKPDGVIPDDAQEEG
mgnify:CR=1 FL=1